MDKRLANLFGVTALAATDRLRAAVERELPLGGAAPAALVHLDAYPGEPVEALRRVLRLSQPGTVRLLDRLGVHELVERRAGRDGRTRALFLTPRGREAVQRILARRAASLNGVLESLTRTEQAQLRPLLEKLVSGLAEDRPEALVKCRLCDREACCREPGCPLDHTTNSPREAEATP
ncbi:MAG: MarR family winged helix-turn-helix transcriptional regulator [Gaiellaceae bacterium]